jgi:hypothetical protein
MKDFPESLQLDPAVEVEVGIPTWHINKDGDDCKANFSLSYMYSIGWTYGEDVKMTWAQTNSLRTSIREMGPGAQHETLDDHWCGLNFQKIVGFREFFYIIVILYLLYVSLKLRNLVSQVFQGSLLHA